LKGFHLLLSDTKQWYYLHVLADYIYVVIMFFGINKNSFALSYDFKKM